MDTNDGPLGIVTGRGPDEDDETGVLSGEAEEAGEDKTVVCCNLIFCCSARDNLLKSTFFSPPNETKLSKASVPAVDSTKK